MRFKRRFRVQASCADVAHFHQSAASLRAITPAPMQVHAAPDPLKDGDEIIFTVWLGPIPVRWHGRIEGTSAEGFTDTQISGPFGSWHHRHNFIAISDGVTEVYDVVQAEMPRLPSIRYIPAALMWISLPLLFAFRAWRTRRLLEAPA